jgi:two-component system catabolic regulation response regulator CreB
MKHRILVVEDEPSIMDNIVYTLESEGFEPIGCATGGEALALAAAHAFDLVLLDIGLPDQNGRDVCRQLRSIVAQIPIIFLTARAEEIDRVVGLEIGADDYIAKPFSPRELCARIRAVLRRCGAAPPPHETPTDQPMPRTKAFPFEIDDERMRITYFQQPLCLSATEFRLLSTLCEHPGRVFSRAQLMDRAWAEPETSMERTVDAHIKSIRAKLRKTHPALDPIETHRGLGYAMREDW